MAAGKTKPLIQEGFFAQSRVEELPARGIQADVLLSRADVTEEILRQ